MFVTDVSIQLPYILGTHVCMITKEIVKYSLNICELLAKCLILPCDKFSKFIILFLIYIRKDKVS